MASVDIQLKATDNTKAGIDSAVVNLNKLDGAASKIGGSMGVASGLMQGWTRSQYAAAQAGGMLTDRAITLGRAVASGNMSIAQATREYKAYENQLKKSVFQQMSFAEKMDVIRPKLNAVATGMAQIGAAAVGVGLAGKAIYNFARSGAEIGAMEIKFGRLSQSVGTTSELFLNDMRRATKGTVSDFALLRQGSDLLQLGLAKDADEATRLSKVMTALGMDTGELTLALANQSKRRLDQLGLSLSAFNKIESKLKESGMGKEEAFKEAFLQTAEQTVMTTGNRADTDFGAFLMLQAQSANMFNSAKQMLGTNRFIVDTVRDVGLFMEGMSRLMGGETQFDLNAGNGMWVRGSQAQDLSSLWSGQGRDWTNSRGGAITGHSAVQSYTAMAFANRNATGGSEETAEEVAQNYELLLDGSLKITQQTEKYKDVTAGLNSQLMEQTILLQETAKKYGLNSEKAKEAYAALQETQSQLGAAREAQASTGGGMVMSNLAGMGADPQVMLDFALAAGMVTKEAHAAQTAYIGVAEAINTGVVSAGMGSQLAGNIAGQLGKLNGQTFTTYVDVVVRWIGDSRIFGGAGGLNQSNQAAVQNCFATDTLILMADGSQKAIQDVVPGDEVLSYNTDSKQIFPATVAETYHHAPEEMGEYFLIINETIRVTPNHPLYINGEWQNAEVIKFADILKTKDGETGVSSVVKIFRKIATYNLHIDNEYHNYFADGILAHNKAGGGWVKGPGDGTKDTMLVPLANEEFVVNSKRARENKEVLEAINDGRFLFPGMAGGGSIGGGTRSHGGGSLGGRQMSSSGRIGGSLRNAPSRRSGSSGSVLSFSSFSIGGDGGGGESAAQIIPEITAAVAGAVQQELSASQQLATLSESVSELKAVNDTLVAILEKMASANDIGRSVRSANALQA